MKIRPLAVSSKRAEEVEAFVNLPIEKLIALRSKLEARATSFPRLSDMSEMIREEVGQKAAEPLLKHLISLRRFADARKAVAADVFDALVAGLEKFGWASDKTSNLIQRRQVLIDLIGMELIHKAYKTADLYYNHDCHLHEIAIYTELRPVFDEDRKSIGAVILYSDLKIVFSDKFESETSLNIALKKDEIERLRAECERALQKWEVAERFLKDKSGVPVINYVTDSFRHG